MHTHIYVCVCTYTLYTNSELTHLTHELETHTPYTQTHFLTRTHFLSPTHSIFSHELIFTHELIVSHELILSDTSFSHANAVYTLTTHTPYTHTLFLS